MNEKTERMNKYLFILGTAVMALFAACSTDDGFDAEEAARLEKEREAAILIAAISDSEVPITIGTGTRTNFGVTRAPLEPDANGLFTTEAGKYLGVFCLAVGKQTGAPANISALNSIDWKVEGDYRPLIVKMSNVPAKVTHNGSYSDVVFLNETDLASSTETPETWFYPMNDWVRYNFYAYYPRQEVTVGNNTTLTFSQNQVLEKYYEIDGSQDILWGMGTSNDQSFGDALPYCAKYFRKKTAALGPGETIADYYPMFNFDHKLTRFDFNIKAASADDAAVLNAKGFKVKKMWIDNVLYRLSLVVANKNDESRNGVLSMLGSAPQRKALNVKQGDADFDRFDQDGDDTADNPLDVSSTASDVSVKNVGYLMVPPTAVDNIDYILKVEVEYEQNSVQKTETLEYVPTPSSNGFLAGYKYNVNLTFYAPTEAHAYARLNGWGTGTDIDLE
jgi:hypothetical protein